jgi:hypothetical protein
MSTDNRAITEFLRLLVEWGGVYKVRDDMMIVTAEDDMPVLVTIGNNQLPLMLFSDNMKAGKHTFFNPLVETLGHSSERTWFMQSRMLILGVMIKRMMQLIVSKCLSDDEDLPYDLIEAVSPYRKRVDAKLEEEIGKIEPLHMLRIIYNKPKRTAQAQTDIFDEEYIESLKIRKKSVEVIQDMLVTFLGTEEVHETYVHKATIVSMPETDAFLHVLLMLSQTIGNYAKVLLNRDLRVVEFEQHMEHLEEYRKMCAWAVTSTVQHDRAAVKTAQTPVTWKPSSQSQIVSGVLPTTSQTMPWMQGRTSVLPKTDPSTLVRMANYLAQNPFADANMMVQSVLTPQQPLFTMPQSGGGVVLAGETNMMGGSVLPSPNSDNGIKPLPPPRRM